MKICQMDKDFILFRCAHFGPLSPSNIEEIPADISGVPKEQFERNKKLFARMIDAYGSCAMLAVDGDRVVAHARFYPQIIYDWQFFCCQDPQHAATQQMVEMDLPTVESPADRIVRIACFLVHKDYRGQGLGHALLDGVLDWARAHDWKAVRAWASPDNYWLASQTCAPMLRTYSKHGFQKVKTCPPSEFPSSLVRQLLMEIREGKFGAERKKEFEEFCGGQDLSELAVLHEVECEL